MLMLMGTSFLAWLGWIGFSFICLVFTFNNALKISLKNFGDNKFASSERFLTHYENSSGSHVPSRSNYVNLFVKKFFHWTLVVYLSLETIDSHYVDMNNLEFPLWTWQEKNIVQWIFLTKFGPFSGAIQ